MKVAIVLGIAMRSGTNYLHDLLVKHPQCTGAREIWEDYVLADLQYVSKYFDVLGQFWKKFPFDHDKICHSKAAVGSVLLELLGSQDTEKPDATYLVTKTPSFIGLERAPDFFPDSKFFLLVRDGRSVVFSLEKSFSVNFFDGLEIWRQSARQLLAFRDAYPDFFQQQCHLVRYEDVFLNPKQELSTLFEAIDLDPQDYDFNEAEQLEVRGSSELKDKDGSVHWEKVERTVAFNPLSRYEAWPVWKQQYAQRFLQTEMEQLGYAMAPIDPSPLLGIRSSLHALGQFRPSRIKTRVKQWAKAQLLDR